MIDTALFGLFVVGMWYAVVGLLSVSARLVRATARKLIGGGE